MQYFSDHYHLVKFPSSADGLRNAQLGAVHALCAHFSLHDKVPALIVLPTGTGKTAVLIMAAFLLKAKRVLVLSSSVLVRGQIVDEFTNLTTLKRLSVVPSDINMPSVKEVMSPIHIAENWDDLRNYEVVVGIPASLVAGIQNEANPPADLFDLILIDEAHHAPAKTWDRVLDYFSEARKILFTATPFRRDKKEVPGKLVYNYPLSRAKADEVFGEIGYLPVTPSEGESEDVALAKAAEKVFMEDQAAGLSHYLMVRTEKRQHAKELLKIYSEQTSLKLRKIDSSQSFQYIKKSIKALKEKKLDGIICVNMLGEGFDFPNLKIAAIHSPHKSLAITLQFIGRFSRTNADNIGKAKFLASPNNIALGKHLLYQEGAIWDEMIINLSEERIEKEDATKMIVDSFVLDESTGGEREKFSLYNINPFFHVKIYRVADFDVDALLEIRGHEIIYHYKSEDQASIVFISREIKKPKWLNLDDLVNTNHFIFILFYFEEEGLLFLNSSIRTAQFYDFLLSQFSTSYLRIPKEDINKVLANLKDIDFFNIGMQSRAAGSGESYKTITGSSAQNVIRKSDGRMYSNGHIYAKAKNEDNSALTIGYSSGSKIWSNAYLKIDEFIERCKIFGKKINSDVVVVTNTGFDHLPIGKPIKEFPQPIYSITWDHHTFTTHPTLFLLDKDAQILSEQQLLDFDIVFISEGSTTHTVNLELQNEALVIRLSYSFDDHFKILDQGDVEYIVEELDLAVYLNEYSLKFYLTDFSMVHNHEWHQTPVEGDLHYDQSLITIFDWEGYNVDITKEFYDTVDEKKANSDKNSIHEGLLAFLEKQGLDVLIYDHGSGEMADFVTIKENNSSIDIELYHAKKSGGQGEGDRVSDVYDVCGQANKSLVWTTNKQTFLKKLTNRVRGKEDKKFLYGNFEKAKDLVTSTKMLKFAIYIVQPGISQSALSEKISTVLASSHNYIQSNGNNERFGVLASS